MLNKIIEKSLQNRASVIFIFAMIVILGSTVMVNLPIDAIPDITPTQVMVVTKTGALGPEQVEKTITYYIETEMAGLPKVKEVRSLTRFGLSQVIVIFEEGSDIYWARQLVMERLQNVRDLLPQGMSPKLGPISTGLGEVLMYVVKAKKGSALAGQSEKKRLLYLRTIQDFVIRPYLKSTIPDIAEIDVVGGYKKEIHIDFIPSKLAYYGISVEEVVSRLESTGENFGGGYIQKNGKQITVRTWGLMSSLRQIGNIPVRLNVFGTPIRVKQIAYVRQDHVQRVGAATYNGQETVLGTVFMLLGANSRKVAKDAEMAVNKIKLPSDVEIKIAYNRTFLVDATIRTVGTNLAEGAALVIIVLLLILGNIRAAFMVSLAIPVSMLFAISGMKYFGISANLMSLGAIDFGLLVDGAVVIIENVLRKMEDQGGGARQNFSEKFKLILEASGDVVKPVTFGLLIIMVVYVPILSLEGIEGKMFKPMALTVLMALGASLLVAVLLMPVLAFTFLKQPDKHKKDPVFFRLISSFYKPVLNFSLNHRAVILTPVVIFGLFTFYLFSRMGSDFVPPLNEGDMSIGFVRDSSMGIDESSRQQKENDRIIISFPEVRHTFSRIGVAESATDPMGVNMGDSFVILEKDLSKWPLINGRRRTKAELFHAIKKKIDKKNPGQEMMATQPIEFRFNEILEGSRADVSLRIFGSDLEKLLVLQDQAKEIVEKIRGVSEVELDANTALRKGPFLNIYLNYDKIARYGVAIKEVNNALETAMSGRPVGSFYEFDWRFPIVVRMAEKYRSNFSQIRGIPIGLTEGGTIPLSMVTSIQNKDQINNIARNRSRRYAAVAINLGDRDITSFVNEAREKIKKNLKLPKGYETYWGGQFKNLARAKERLLVIIPITLLLIFVLLLKTFGSLRQTVLVYSAIPFAMTGGILSLFMRDIHLSVSAAVGFIALTGIAILNGMVMVTFFNQLRKEGKSIDEAVRNGSMIRLRPVVMTALVASLGFIPMALNTGLGAEVQRPLATVVIGGLFTATILTLLLLPTLYLWLEGRKEKILN